MKKISAILILVASTTSVMSEEAVSVNTGKGLYIGAGMGSSRFTVSRSGSSCIKLNSDLICTHNESDFEDRDSGSLLYAGYQFNKIIAVEAAYTEYGDFSKVINGIEYSQAPTSFAVYANAGYTFFNGQLRPFGIGGLGYLNRNQSRDYDSLGFNEDFVTLHLGFGVDYYPAALRGFGFRLSFSSDLYPQSDYHYTDTTADTDSLLQNYSVLYAGVQYKF